MPSIKAAELGAVAGLALVYPFYILCRTLKKKARSNYTTRLRSGRALAMIEARGDGGATTGGITWW